VPADVEQKGVQVVPQINGPQIAVALDDPPMGRMDALLPDGNRPVRLLSQAFDPLRENLGVVEVGIRSETQARPVLVGTWRPLVTRREP
jgi:hypothetical protein